MGLWRVPAKVLLPAEPDYSPGTFEFNGRLANGDQVMDYVGSTHGQTHPPTVPFTRHTAVLFRFDADGALLAVDFATTTTVLGGGHVEQDEDRGWAEARELLGDSVRRVRAEGWMSADILVRPFLVVVDGLETGLVYETDGEDESGTEEGWADYSPECLRLVPFDAIFRRPWTTGEYDT